MKKYFSIAMMLIVAIMGVAFSSCSKDKDEPAPQTDPSLYCGTWTCVSSTDTQNGQTLTDLLKGQTITINADGTYTSTSPAVGKTGRYVMEGNKITVTTGGQTIIVTCTFADNYNSMTWDGNANGYNFHYVFQKKKTVSLNVAYTHAVDLGLSVKWADMNVGAQKPEDKGWFFAWGETEKKLEYNWSTYKWCQVTSRSQYMTKYSTSQSANRDDIDNKTVLDPEDDAATVNWGGNWRMPTKAEQEELYNKCTMTWTNLNGVNGYKITGPNGNSIFLPAGGYCNNDWFGNSGSTGSYWSSSLDEYFSDKAYVFGFSSNRVYVSSSERFYGHNVRAVCP